MRGTYTIELSWIAGAVALAAALSQTTNLPFAVWIALCALLIAVRLVMFATFSKQDRLRLDLRADGTVISPSDEVAKKKAPNVPLSSGDGPLPGKPMSMTHSIKSRVPRFWDGNVESAPARRGDGDLRGGGDITKKAGLGGELKDAFRRRSSRKTTRH